MASTTVAELHKHSDEAIKRLMATAHDAKQFKGFAYPKVMVELTRVVMKLRAEGMFKEAASMAYRGLEMYESLKALHHKDPNFKI